MRITRNEKYSHWEHKSFKHVQNFRAGLLNLHRHEKYTIWIDRNWLEWPGIIPRPNHNGQFLHIRQYIRHSETGALIWYFIF